MKFSTNKVEVTAVIFVLVLTFAATFVALPIVSAHDPAWEITVFTYALVRPNPVGVGQEAMIIFWPNLIPPTANGPYGDRYTWTVEVTKPDNSKQTLGPFTSDPIGGGWTSYTPDQVGTYTFVATVDEHTLTGLPISPDSGIYNPANVNDTILASSSEPVSLVVQEDPIEGWRETPLPTEYWTRPINGMNRDWYRLAGNWLAGAAQNVGPTTGFGYGLGPESAHVMWATPMWAGGIMDERFGNIGYQSYHYEGLNFFPPIVLNGKLYYNVESIPRYGWYCVDLYTGETEYFHNTTGPVVGTGKGHYLSGRILDGLLSFGQIYNYESPNQHGGFPYLWSAGNLEAGPNGMPSTTWMMFDAFTGNWICSIENVPLSGTLVYGKEGSILKYNINNGRLTCWNTSRAIWYKESFVTNTAWMWRPVLNMTYDAANGYSLNVSIPDVQGRLLAVREGEFVIGGTGGQNDKDAVVQGNLWALSLKPGEEGTLLWSIAFNPPRASATATEMGGRSPVSGPTVVPEYNVFFFEEAVTLQRWVYDLTTGQQLWETDPDPALNFYGMTDNIYQGKLLTYGYGGVLIAYNITTGEKLWTYTATNVGYESPYGNYPIGIGAIADGKIYLGSGEHSATQPIWRGPNLRCVDAETGKELWKISMHGVSMPMGNGGSNYAIADGYLLALNAYDNQIYCYGKGPSATTVSIKNDVIAKGNTVLIQGTVTDECAGAKKLIEEGKFNIIPAIADEYQEDWMEYLYMQQPCPMDLNGVTVKLEAFGEDGSYSELGTVTSNSYGDFVYEWTPPDEGVYTIMSTFEGSDSYGSSYDATYLSVGPAAAPSGPIEPEPTEPSEAPLITTEVAIIVAVVIAAIVGVVAYWALRKRK